jgi:hypothetical protein
MEKLLTDDFRRTPVGSLYEPYTALGEYHVPATLRQFGVWTEATVYHGWKGPVWAIVEEEGKHALEQLRLTPYRTPMLTCGDSFWRDYEIKALVRPLSAKAQIGIIVRYRDCRSFYVAGFSKGEMFIEVREHEERKVLASAPADYLDKDYLPLTVRVFGNKISVSALGKQLTACDDRYTRGKAGLLAECPARFQEFTVFGDPQAGQKERQAEMDAVAGERQRYPQPRLLNRFSLGNYGTGRQVRFGDLNGDGKKEILLAQCTERVSGDFPQINLLTALTAEGKVLWQYGEATAAPLTATADLPFQVADVDGDGKAEVIFIKDQFIRIVDGATGKEKAKAPTPLAPDPATATWYTEHSAKTTDYHRINGDAIALGRLRSATRGFDLILKDRYANVWAMTNEFEPLWHRTLSTGHFPLIKDIDGDGLDEVFIGYALLDHDGRLVYELKYGDHVDGIACERLDGPDSAWRVALSAGEEGMILCDLSGKVIAQHKLGHVQKLSVGKFLSGRDELQICTINYWGNPGIMAFYDSRGAILHTLEPVPYASPIEPVNWTGDGRALVFLSGHARDGGLLDGNGRRVVMFPDDSHPYFCGACVDLLGNATDEVVLWDFSSMAVYGPAGTGKGMKLRHSPEHNMSNYRASVLVPW